MVMLFAITQSVEAFGRYSTSPRRVFASNKSSATAK
jgi:hypothetical protein